MEGRRRRCWELSIGGRLRRLERNTAGGAREGASMEGEDALDLGREEGAWSGSVREKMERWKREA